MAESTQSKVQDSLNSFERFQRLTQGLFKVKKKELNEALNRDEADKKPIQKEPRE